MSAGVDFLHSHSGLERELKFPKKYVLIDTKYGEIFGDALVKPFTHEGRDYYKVNIYLFWRKGGIFKNLYR